MRLRFRIRSLFFATLVVAIVSFTYVRLERYRYLNSQGRLVLKQARVGDFKSIKDHVNAGGDPNQTDEWGLTVAFYAISFSDRDALDLLIRYGCRLKYGAEGIEDNLQNAISAGDYQVIRMVLESGEWDCLTKLELDPYFKRSMQRNDATVGILTEHFAIKRNQPK